VKMVVGETGRHAVVEDHAVLVEHQAVATAPDTQVGEVVGVDAVEERRRVLGLARFGGAGGATESDPAPAKEVAFAAWSLVHGMAIIWLDGAANDDLPDRGPMPLGLIPCQRRFVADAGLVGIRKAKAHLQRSAGQQGRRQPDGDATQRRVRHGLDQNGLPAERVGAANRARPEIESLVDGAEIFRADLFPAIAANPFITFFTVATESGKFDFEWLKRVMDIMAAANIKVVLCTPTAAPPISITT